MNVRYALYVSERLQGYYADLELVHKHIPEENSKWQIYRELTRTVPDICNATRGAPCVEAYERILINEGSGASATKSPEMVSVSYFGKMPWSAPKRLADLCYGPAMDRYVAMAMSEGLYGDAALFRAVALNTEHYREVTRLETANKMAQAAEDHLLAAKLECRAKGVREEI